MRLDSPFADRVTALSLFLLGAAATYGGFVMDRLEVRQIHPASIPGLLPMILGAALMICALALAWSARAQPAPAGQAGDVSWLSLGVALVLSGLYALAAVGNMPFALASGLYMAAFTLWFLWNDEGGSRRPRIPTLVGVLAFSAVAAYSISVMFEDGFLVRLP